MENGAAPAAQADEKVGLFGTDRLTGTTGSRLRGERREVEEVEGGDNNESVPRWNERRKVWGLGFICGDECALYCIVVMNNVGVEYLHIAECV